MHTDTLVHTQSPSGPCVLSSVSEHSRHHSALTAAPKALGTVALTYSQSMAQGCISSENGTVGVVKYSFYLTSKQLVSNTRVTSIFAKFKRIGN